MKVLITGASGFVGHHVVEHFLKTTDWDIITLDRLSQTTKSDGFDRLRDVNAYDSSRVIRYTHDLNQPIGEGLAKEIGKMDYVFHIAADSHVDNSITDPVPFVMNNVKSVLTMLEYIRKHTPTKFLYFSTDEVYGTAPQGVDYVEGDRYNSGNPYSASKAAAEQICYAYSNTYKLPIIITNCMNILGERQHTDKFLPKIINYVLDNKVLPIHSNPDKTKAGQRHYIHARNIADALHFIVTQTDELLDSHNPSIGKFNIVGEKEMDNLELARLVAGIMDRSLRFELVDFHSQRPGHDLRYALSGKKLADLGWKPPVTIEDSIKKIVDWTLKPENSRWLDRE